MKNMRNSRGSMLLLIVCIIVLVSLPILIGVCKLGPFCIFRGRAQNVVEAASLLAAQDLSRIISNDPNFGFLSLSSHAPEGNATLALDGNPLPVTGINTLVGTLRQISIVTNEIRNQRMTELLDKDLYALKIARKNLISKLRLSLIDSSPKGDCIDVNGQIVNPVQDVEEFLSHNLPPNLHVKSIKLSLGWLEGGSETSIPLPQPLKYAHLDVKEIGDGQYESFKSYPVGNRSFSFAGLGSQAHMVSNYKFKEDDGLHICSVVKLEVILYSDAESSSKMHCIACSQAYALPDFSTFGAMTVRFSGKPLSGLFSWNEFLTKGCFQDNKIVAYDVLQGDFPYEKESKLKRAWYDTRYDTSDSFAESLYYWLRNGHLAPRVDAILAMLNEPFNSSDNQVYLYEFKKDGSISRKIMEGTNFTRAVTASGQVSTMSDTRIRSGANAIVFFRNNVKDLNTKKAKHAGQALVNYPFGNSNSNVDYHQLCLQFAKRCQNASGLALDIEIGGTRESSARKDVISMRTRTSTRRI